MDLMTYITSIRNWDDNLFGFSQRRAHLLPEVLHREVGVALALERTCAAASRRADPQAITAPALVPILESAHVPVRDPADPGGLNLPDLFRNRSRLTSLRVIAFTFCRTYLSIPAGVAG
jgi:hypothetical protein